MEEEWQRTTEEEGEEQEAEEAVGGETLSEEITERWMWLKGLEVLEGLLVIVFCWVASISLVFRITILVEVPILVAVFAFVKLVLKGIVAYRDRDQDNPYDINLWSDFI